MELYYDAMPVVLTNIRRLLESPRYCTTTPLYNTQILARAMLPTGKALRTYIAQEMGIIRVGICTIVAAHTQSLARGSTASPYFLVTGTPYWQEVQVVYT